MSRIEMGFWKGTLCCVIEGCIWMGLVRGFNVRREIKWR